MKKTIENVILKHSGILLLCCFITFIFLGSEAHAKRIALVVGNNDYISVPKLQKAVNDANAMSTILQSAGFEVELLTNAGYREFIRAIDKFSRHIDEKDQVVFYYAGHGVQLKSGNYLLPIDIDAESQDIVEKTSYNLDDLTLMLGKRRSSFQLIIVDACRDNPFASMTRSTGLTRGLMPVEPVKGQLVVYSASRGQQALDRLGPDDTNPNGVFTRKLISKLSVAGLSAAEVVRSVQDDVEQLASSVHHEQRPAIYDESRGNFYFFGSPKNKEQEKRGQLEDGYWIETKSLGSIEAFEAYIKAYPEGNYIHLAKAYITKLKETLKPSNDAERQALKNELIFWDTTRKKDSREGYQLYLNRYPSGFFASIASDYLNLWDQKDILTTSEKYANQDDKEKIEKDRLIFMQNENRIAKEEQARFKLAKTLATLDVPTF